MLGDKILYYSNSGKRFNVKWCMIGIYLLILHRFWDNINIKDAKKQNEHIINDNRNSEQ